jgi:hypothetical protein
MAVSAGWAYSQYVKTDGTLWIAGNGNINPTIQASNVVALAGGADGLDLGNSPYITSDATLWLAVPTPVSIASNVVMAVAGGAHTLFVTMDGTLCAMGAKCASEKEIRVVFGCVAVK